MSSIGLDLQCRTSAGGVLHEHVELLSGSIQLLCGWHHLYNDSDPGNTNAATPPQGDSGTHEARQVIVERPTESA